MDVEGSEYPLIEHLRANEVLPLIDEIFIETHFNHPSMAAFGWGTFIAKRPDAHALLRQVWRRRRWQERRALIFIREREGYRPGVRVCCLHSCVGAACDIRIHLSMRVFEVAFASRSVFTFDLASCAFFWISLQLRDEGVYAHAWP